MTAEIRNISVSESSIEIGTPGKGGVLKLYFNPDNKEEAEKRLTAAIELLKKARESII